MITFTILTIAALVYGVAFLMAVPTAGALSLIESSREEKLPDSIPLTPSEAAKTVELTCPARRKEYLVQVVGLPERNRDRTYPLKVVGCTCSRFHDKTMLCNQRCLNQLMDGQCPLVAARRAVARESVLN